jgi:hypothetical protein
MHGATIMIRKLNSVLGCLWNGCMKIGGDRVKGKAQGLSDDTDLIQFKFYRMPMPLPSDLVLIKGFQSVSCA